MGCLCILVCGFGFFVILCWVVVCVDSFVCVIYCVGFNCVLVGFALGCLVILFRVLTLLGLR